MKKLSVFQALLLQVFLSSWDVLAAKNKDILTGFTATWAPSKEANPMAFDKLPKSSTKASELGWKQEGNGCEDPNKTFKGSRYVKDGDYSVMPLYDANGNVAGLQFGVLKQVLKEKSPVDFSKLSAAQNDTIKGEELYVTTAYFTEPEKVCKGRSSQELETQGTVEQLFIKNKDGFWVAPMFEDKKALESQDWSGNKCFPGMGTHYFRILGEDMKCTEFYPWVIMYDRTQDPPRMSAFAFFTLGNFTTPLNRYEHMQVAEAESYISPTPGCLHDALVKAGGTTSMHIFIDQNSQKITCNNN